MRYPLTLKPDRNGTIIAEAWMSQALTVGHDARDASVRAVDALITLFADLMAKGEPVPRPSRPKRGQPYAKLPPWSPPSSRSARRCRRPGSPRRRWPSASAATRARCVGCSSRPPLGLDPLEAALSAFGKRLVVDVQDAARSARPRGGKRS